ncbi:hypothetical protein EV182_004804 [Spiromyces aspiralis]|uniref:Uncharacterized protein n=1 Tax=Spiromyces aspiralis TaxID=68401 RepID=A0ACC1HEA8_9FUNG|nr:hypothetical protein EV182_004804 [Spiromyces aspiralis]
MGKHTIIMIQKTGNTSSRTYFDYESVDLAVEGIIQMYEKRLKVLFPNKTQINYHIEDLKKFIDQHSDIYEPPIKAYTPRDREWIKEAIHNHLRKIYADSQRATQQ